MNTLVMADGSAAATKAIELAGVPGGPLMRRSDGSQLIITHVWDKAPASGAVFTSEAVESALGGGGGDLGSANPTATPGNNASASLGTASSKTESRAPSTVEAAVRAAVQTAGTPFESMMLMDEGNGVPQASRPLPCVFVAQRVLQTIHESKSLKDTLNYKIETNVLPPAPLPPSRVASPAEVEVVSPRTKGGKQKGATGAGAAARQQPGQGFSSADSKATLDPAAAGGVSEDEAHVDAAAEAALAEALRLLEYRASGIVQYAADRAAHHSCRAVVLGAGARQVGKSITIGSVARKALHTLSHDHLLYYVKADGFLLRPSTTVVRHVVVVPLREDAEEEDASVVAVKEAQKWCRGGGVDRVAVVLVAEPADASKGQNELLERYTKRFTELLGDEVTASSSSGSAPKAQEERQNADTATSTAEQPTADRAEGSTEAAAAEWPAVSVCELKSSKHCPNPALDVPAAMQQVVKFLQQRKAEVMVVAASAPEALQLALIGMTKPHCLIVPRHL